MIGEAGKEAVVPLERTEWIDTLANKINETSNNSQPIHVVVKVGEDTLIEKIIEGVREKNFEQNGEVSFSI